MASRVPVRRRRVAIAGLLILAALAAGLAYVLTRPPRLPYAVAGVPASARQEATALLAAAGYVPAGPPAWAGGQPAWQAPGTYRLFFAAAPPGGVPDVYLADLKVDAAGRPALAAAVRPLTQTAAGAEAPPVAAGSWLAFATQVAGYYQSIAVVPLDALESRHVFAFARPPEQLQMAWSATPSPVLTIALPSEQASLSVDPATLRVEPPGDALAYMPATRGEFSWLPNLVSRVRELPFVGPEKIAFLENVFFTAQDRVTLWLHAARTKVAPAGPTVHPATAQAAQVAAAAPTAPAPSPSAPPGLPAAPAPETATPSDLPATSSPETATPAGKPSPAPTALPSPAPPPAEQPAPATASAMAPSPSPTVPPSPVPPPAASPMPTAPPVPTAPPAAPEGPGAGQPLAYGVLRRAPVQPDPQRPYAQTEVIEIDPGLLAIGMVPGTVEPQPSTGLIGTGVIPDAARGALVAAFNGGFAAMHGAFGMMVDRKVYLPPRDGVATLAVYEDGSIRMGTWGKDLVQTPDTVSYRQNCPPLIENGTITAETGKLTLWGLSVSNEVYLYRSGLGVTADGRLVYVAGKPLSAYTLARALQMAGAVYAMQLDVDEFHVAFITYDRPAGQEGNAALVGHKLREDMRGFDGFFLRPFQLDFFYLLRRAEPLPNALRVAAAPQAAADAAAGRLEGLPGRLAFASNRDGNWEIYALDPGRPETLRRLTDDPADDLTPAWDPGPCACQGGDGCNCPARLAFASRRSGNSEVYWLDLATQAVHPVTQQPSEEWAPAWSPDGARIAYQSDRNGQSDIYLAAVDGSGEVRLTPQQGNHEAPAWSPDGQQIAFDSDLDVAEAVHASINLYLMGLGDALRGGAAGWPRRLFNHAESPAWSPDGRRIAFTGRRGGQWQIMLVDANGAGYRQLTTGGYDARYPAWSPDGRWLAFAANAEGHWEVYVLPVEPPTGPAAGVAYPFRLTYGQSDSSYPTWAGPPQAR